MAANDIYELNVDSTLGGQNLCNTYHCKQTSADGTGDARTAVHLWWVEFFRTNWLLCCSILLEQVQTRVRRIDPTTTQSLIVADPSPGAISVEPLPPQSCAILRTHAVPLGRRGTGHVKMAGVTIEACHNGRIDNVQRLAMLAFGLNMESAKTETTTGYKFHMCVFSQVDLIGRPIVKTEALTRIKTVHSRSVGVGN